MSIMRSQLTRSVFRRIVQNAIWSDTRGHPRPVEDCCLKSLHIRQNVQRRSFFGLYGKPKRKVKPVNLDPGFESMLQLNQMLSQATRPPPPEQLARAFSEFFEARGKSEIPLEDIQIEHALATFNHLRDAHAGAKGFDLKDDDLRRALHTLIYLREDQQSSEARKQLAKLLFEELKFRRTVETNDHTQWGKVMLDFVTILTQCNETHHARSLVEQSPPIDMALEDRKLWMLLLVGFARERNTQEILQTIEDMKQRGIPFDSTIHQCITTYYADTGAVDMTKKWYDHPIAGSELPKPETNHRVVKFCIRHNQLVWGEPIFRTLVEQAGTAQRSWRVIFQWAAAKGKSVEEIEAMIEIMIHELQKKDPDFRVNIGIINGLIEHANSRNDPYTAERYLAMGHKWGLTPNARTYLLQVDYRVKVGDLDGALSAYRKLQVKWIPNNFHIPRINRLIVALCAEKHPNFEVIMGLADDLKECKARFDPATVRALAGLHLQRGENEELVDLLNTYAFQFGLEQRADIYDMFASFCLDRSKSTARVWDAYCILQQIFPEIDVDLRTKIMNEFFDRERSDMAYHVFGHMRQQEVGAHRPTVDTYVACFEGIAKSADIEALRIVHNMLKLDTQVDPNTRLYNSLMLAFTACGEARRSLGFWDDIVHSREGPTYNSIRIAFRACEAAPLGDRVARDIWARLKKFQIDVGRDIYAAYIGALAGHSLYTECVRYIQDAEKEVGGPPDKLMYARSLKLHVSSY